MDTPSNGLYMEASPESSTFFRLHVNKKIRISQVEVHERAGKSVIFNHLKGSLIIIFPTDAPYGCIINLLSTASLTSFQGFGKEMQCC